MNAPAAGVPPGRMARRRRYRLLYAVVIALITISFGWQMLHGICPVP
jgi:hypothetical protein